MIELVISGGQTGADQAGWRAAKAAGIPTGGWMPKGYRTEDGPRPEFAALYGARMHASSSYVPRTQANVKMSGLTIVFDASQTEVLERMSKGTRAAIKAAMHFGVPSFVVQVTLDKPSYEKRWLASAGRIREVNPRVLNIAGNRESSAPGIGEWVERYLAEVFRILQEET